MRGSKRPFYGWWMVGAAIVLVSGAAARIIASNIERNDTGSEFSRLAREIAREAIG